MKYFISYTVGDIADAGIESTIVEGDPILSDRDILDIEHRIREGVGGAAVGRVRLIAAHPLGTQFSLGDAMEIADRISTRLRIGDKAKSIILEELSRWEKETNS